MFLKQYNLYLLRHRNLCLRVMLVEVSAAVNPGDSTSLHHMPHKVLRHVYSSMPGDMFVDFAHTQVSQLSLYL
jgi:hypothetical protein